MYSSYVLYTCFQSLIGLPNLLSTISCYKPHIVKDYGGAEVISESHTITHH